MVRTTSDHPRVTTPASGNPEAAKQSPATPAEWGKQHAATLRSDAANLRGQLPEAYRDLPEGKLADALRTDLGESSPLYRWGTIVERKERMAKGIDGAVARGDTAKLIRWQDAQDNVGAMFQPREWGVKHRDDALRGLADARDQLRTAVGAKDFDVLYAKLSPSELTSALTRDYPDNGYIQRAGKSIERATRSVAKFNEAIAAYDKGDTAPLARLAAADRKVDSLTVDLRAAQPPPFAEPTVRNPAAGLAPPAPQKHR